jgi:hypothetical protein
VLASVEAVLESPARLPGSEYPLGRSAVPAGRLDRFLPPGATDGLRRIMRRFPRFDDGWGEWPGALSALSAAESADLLTTLRRLDQES